LQAHIVLFSLQFSGIQSRLSKHGKAIQWEVGVIKLTAKPASVLANKPQLEGKTGINLTYGR